MRVEVLSYLHECNMVTDERCRIIINISADTALSFAQAVRSLYEIGQFNVDELDFIFHLWNTVSNNEFLDDFADGLSDLEYYSQRYSVHSAPNVKFFILHVLSYLKHINFSQDLYKDKEFKNEDSKNLGEALDSVREWFPSLGTTGTDHYQYHRHDTPCQKIAQLIVHLRRYNMDEGKLRSFIPKVLAHKNINQCLGALKKILCHAESQLNIFEIVIDSNYNPKSFAEVLISFHHAGLLTDKNIKNIENSTQFGALKKIITSLHENLSQEDLDFFLKLNKKELQRMAFIISNLNDMGLLNPNDWKQEVNHIDGYNYVGLLASLFSISNALLTDENKKKARELASHKKFCIFFKKFANEIKSEYRETILPSEINRLDIAQWVYDNAVNLECQHEVISRFTSLKLHDSLSYYKKNISTNNTLQDKLPTHRLNQQTFNQLLQSSDTRSPIRECESRLEQLEQEEEECSQNSLSPYIGTNDSLIEAEISLFPDDINKFIKESNQNSLPPYINTNDSLMEDEISLFPDDINKFIKESNQNSLPPYINTNDSLMEDESSLFPDDINKFVKESNQNSLPPYINTNDSLMEDETSLFPDDINKIVTEPNQNSLPPCTNANDSLGNFNIKGTEAPGYMNDDLSTTPIAFQLSDFMCDELISDQEPLGQIFPLPPIENTNFLSRAYSKNKSTQDLHVSFSRKYTPDELLPPLSPTTIRAKSKNINPTYHNRFELKRLSSFYRSNQGSPKTSISLNLEEQNQLTLVTTHHCPPSNDNVTTFIFAGRKSSALIPTITEADDSQRLILVVTLEEYDAIKKNNLPNFIEFLVVQKLASPTHGNYENRGAIQTRRLAAFLASYCWNLQFVLYLDDNIDSIQWNPLSSQENTWSNAIENLKTGALISGFKTITTNPKTAFIKRDFAFKLSMLNFQKIRGVLKLEKPNDVFMLGYPAKYSNNCMEDFYFQMLIHHAFYSQKSPNNKENIPLCIQILDIYKAGLKRSNAHANIAAKTLNTFEKILEISLNQEEITRFFTPQKKYWMQETLSLLQKKVQENIKLLEKEIDKAKYRNDLPSLHFQNAQTAHQLSLQTNFFKNTTHQHTNTTEKLFSNSNNEITKFRANRLFSPRELLTSPKKLFGDDFYRFLQQEQISKHLYDYQKHALEKICYSENQASTLELCTGSGKTRIQMILALYLATKGNTPVHIVTANLNLVTQFYQSFKAFLPQVRGIINIDQKCIITVSSAQFSIPSQTFLMNKVIKSQAKIVIFCSKSYMNLINDADSKSYFKNTSPALICLDEFHLYKKNIKLLQNNFSQKTILCFSATPPKGYMPEVIYRYNRKESERNGYTAPLIIDKLARPYIKKDADNEFKKIYHLIRNHRHPLGKPLAHYHGIVYASSTKDATRLAEYLNQKSSKNIAIAIHSGFKDCPSRISSFQSNQPGTPTIAIVVGMLKTGFDDKNIYWCFIAKKNAKNQASIKQCVGRALRRKANPEDKKIAYLVGYQDLLTSSFQCTKDQYALDIAHNDYFKFNWAIMYEELKAAIINEQCIPEYKRLIENKRFCIPKDKQIDLFLLAQAAKYKNFWLDAMQNSPCFLGVKNNVQSMLDFIHVYLCNAASRLVSKKEPILDKATLFTSLLEHFNKRWPGEFSKTLNDNQRRILSTIENNYRIQNFDSTSKKIVKYFFSRYSKPFCDHQHQVRKRSSSPDNMTAPPKQIRRLNHVSIFKRRSNPHLKTDQSNNNTNTFGFTPKKL